MNASSPLLEKDGENVCLHSPLHCTYDRHDIMIWSSESLRLVSWAYMSTMSLAHITQADTALVKTIRPVITALQHRDFSHVKQLHISLWGTINYYIWNYAIKNIRTVPRDKCNLYFPLDNSTQYTIKDLKGRIVKRLNWNTRKSTGVTIIWQQVFP